MQYSTVQHSTVPGTPRDEALQPVPLRVPQPHHLPLLVHEVPDLVEEVLEVVLRVQDELHGALVRRVAEGRLLLLQPQVAGEGDGGPPALVQQLQLQLEIPQLMFVHH